MKRIIAALAVSVISIGAALASPAGTWRVEDGSGSVRVVSCGKAYCGFAENGAQVFQPMRPAGPNAWSGVIVNIRDASRYDGTISELDAHTLRVRGCLPGGGMCGDQTWTRLR